jgi:hypothetical protein
VPAGPSLQNRARSAPPSKPTRRLSLCEIARVEGGPRVQISLAPALSPLRTSFSGGKRGKDPRRRQGTIPTASTSSGTDRSNPAPSRGESGANLIFGGESGGPGFSRSSRGPWTFRQYRLSVSWQKALPNPAGVARTGLCSSLATDRGNSVIAEPRLDPRRGYLRSMPNLITESPFT